MSVTGNTVQFTIQNAWRRSTSPWLAYSCIDPATFATVPCSAPDGLPGPGDVFYEYGGGTQLSTGDVGVIGSPLGPLLYVVTSIDPINEWLFASALDPASLPAIDTAIDYTYGAPGDYTAAIGSCCRISALSGVNAHINNPDGGYRVETLVNVGTGNSSPVSTLPPIILCPQSGLCSFTVPGSDPNGDPLNFRLSTSAEASGSSFGFTQPGPPFATNDASISSTGLYTWDTTGATLAPPGTNTLYSTQVTIEDLNGAGNVKSKVAVDFLIQLVPVVGVPPVFDSPPTPACGSTLTVNAGNMLNFTVLASDSDPGQTVTLNVAGLPVGATMTPSLPTSGNPVNSTFSWTPAGAQVGMHVVTFTATDDTGQQALCSVTIEVLAAPRKQVINIDIKPGSFPNSINLKSKGNVPVAILSDPTFDATTVDPSTVVFAGASPLPIGKSPEDVNGDGLLDVVLHFKTQDLNLQPGDTQACLSGDTFSGQEFEGCDSVRIIN